jgi:hypothetical protein
MLRNMPTATLKLWLMGTAIMSKALCEADAWSILIRADLGVGTPGLREGLGWECF